VYYELRDYSSALRIHDQVLEITPDNVDALASEASIYQEEANLSKAGAVLARLSSDPSYEVLFPTQIRQRIYERRFAEAIDMIKKAFERRDEPLSPAQRADYGSTLADLQQFAGDTAESWMTWEQVKTQLENLLASNKTAGPSYYENWLGEAYAALGDQTKADAIARSLLDDPLQTDPLGAARLAVVKARIAIHAGDTDTAIAQLAIAAQYPESPIGVNYGDLKLNPLWDPLRGDVRFEQIVDSLAPR
jgi:tetratricopeptide (TPR) repeat protein